MGQIKSLAPKDVKVVLVGNKIDCEKWVISREEGEEMAQKY